MSGTLKTKSGSIIPSSKRPDGTIRKEKRVRDGYTAPEDVQKYTNFRLQKPNLPDNYIPGLGISRDVVSNVKASEKVSNPVHPTKKAEIQVVQESVEAKSKEDSHATTEQEPIDTTKKIKSLKKKLRQIQEIQDKKDQGKELLPEQIHKLSTKSNVEEELSTLMGQVQI